MFSKGRKLVDLVKQSDQKREVSSCDADNRIRSTSNKILSQTPARSTRKATEKSKNASERDTDWILDENKRAAILMAESSQINEATVLVDESWNSTTSEQSKILTRHVIIPESPVSTCNTSIISELSSESILEASSTSADKITTASEYLTETTNRILTPHFDSNRSTPVNKMSKYFTDLDSGSIIEDSSHALNGEHPTVAIKKVTDLLVGTIESECSDFLDDSCSAFLDINSIQKSPTSTNAHFTNDEFQSIPSTSKQDDAEILRNDLCMSDDSDVVSPYVDSESSFRPSPSPSPAPSSASEISDNEKENNNDNIPQRRRKGQPEMWHRNIVKKLRQTGQSYVNRKGTVVEPNKMLPADCSKCRYECNQNFPENVRQDIFDEFWKLGDDKRQKMLISSLVKHSNVLRTSTQAKKNRSMSRSYFLAHKSAGQHRVCQKFFCNTFNISTAVINTCSKNVGYSDFYVGQDSRVGKVPYNKTPIEIENLIKEHIDKYPRVESHYCRKKNKKQYLESDLNLSQLYKMYKDDYCVQKQIQHVSMFVYQKIFHSYEPPLAFFKPKKDQCTKCNVYNRAENKSPLQVEYEAHKRRERDSLNMNAEDKQKCIDSNGSFRAITFDMQAILSVTFTGDSKIYYLRKLSLYNFTILDSYKNIGSCYMWDESNGKKGSIEIGTMLLKYFFSLPETVNQVASFSDTCGGQNRNKYVTLAALHAVNNIPHLNTVDLKFMESGHSYLEADSMHASIERARKHKSLFTLREYALIIQSARSKPKPYDVFISKYDDFYDLKALEKELNCNTTKNIDKEIVQWLKIKWLRLSKESPSSIFYKYELQDPEFMEINLCKTRSAKKTQECINMLRSPLKKAYETEMPVSQAKKKDLITLLKDGVIPSEYANYYNNIPCAAEIIHVFTDSEESDDDE